MGISIWQLLIILVIVILLFGTKRLKGLGGDLGGAIKGFRGAIKDGDGEGEGTPGQEKGETIEGEVTSKERDES